MGKAFRITLNVCIMLALGLFVGCSDEDPVTALPQMAPGGSIGVYSDIDATSSKVTDTGGVVTLYVIHEVRRGATASQFRIETPTGWTLLSAQAEFPVAIGSVDAKGISIGYGQCMNGKIHTMTLTYQSPGNSTPGTSFKVMPHQEATSLEVVDCDYERTVEVDGEESEVVLP